MSKEENAFHRSNFDFKLKHKRQDDVHYVWHNFSKKFIEDTHQFKVKGYELMEAAEKWAKKFPDDVRVNYCDDDYHMSSLMLLIEHKTADQYHGITMVSIPQNGQEPSRMFLYPNHREQLIANLTLSKNISQGVIKIQKEKAAEHARQWKKILTLPAPDAKGDP